MITGRSRPSSHLPEFQSRRIEQWLAAQGSSHRPCFDSSPSISKRSLVGDAADGSTGPSFLAVAPNDIPSYHGDPAMTLEYKPRGKYFEDFHVGDEFVTPARTITSTDIVNFACISGDHNEVHMNHEYCKQTPFGEPIAHG